MTITTEHLIIRPLLVSDAEDVFEYESLPEITEPAGSTPITSLEQVQRTLEMWLEEDEKYAICLKETGKVIGHISVDPDSDEDREDTREFSFRIAPPYQKRGYMTETLRAMTAELFSRGIQFIWACCFKGNEASRRVIEKAGFEFIREGEFYSENLDKDFISLEYRISKMPET